MSISSVFDADLGEVLVTSDDFSLGSGVHRAPGVLVAKRVHRTDPHVRPLNDLAARISAAREQSGSVPSFDPVDGGVHARVLCLMACPSRGALADRGSGFVSADNIDLLGRSVYTLREEAGLAPERVVQWNVVPWYLPGERPSNRITARDVEQATPWLGEALDLLPELRVVVPMGAAARRGWQQAQRALPSRDLTMIAVPHPYPTRLKAHPEIRARIVAGLRRAARIAAEDR